MSTSGIPEEYIKDREYMFRRFANVMKLSALVAYKLTTEEWLLILTIVVTVLQMVIDYLKRRD